MPSTFVRDFQCRAIKNPFRRLVSTLVQLFDHTTELRIWDVESGKLLKEMRAQHRPTQLAFCAALSPNGKRIVSGGYDNLIRVLDTATGKELRPYEGHTGYVFGVAFFPDGKRIASASADGTVRIWGTPR
jgi:WD40 repeat protein